MMQPLRKMGWIILRNPGSGILSRVEAEALSILSRVEAEVLKYPP